MRALGVLLLLVPLSACHPRRVHDDEHRLPPTPTFPDLVCSDPITPLHVSPINSGARFRGDWSTAAPGVGFHYLFGTLAAADCVNDPGLKSSQIPTTLKSPVTATTTGTQNLPTSICNPKAGNQQYTIEYAEDSEQLSKALNASASASMKALAWSAEASANFSMASSSSRFSRYLFIDGNVAFSVGAPAKRIELSKIGLALLEKGAEPFRRHCGDHYIQSVTKGGHFTAILHFDSRSESEASKVDSEIKLAVGKFTAKLDFDQAISRISNSVRMSVYVKRSGGGFSPIGTSVSDLYTQVNDFFCHIDEATSIPIEVELADYTNVYTGDKKFLYEGASADTKIETENYRRRLSIEKRDAELSADDTRDDCPKASEEFLAIAQRKSNAISQLDKMNAICRDPSDSRCRSCMPSNEALKVGGTQECKRCTVEGRGVRVGNYCRRCTWEIGNIDLGDPTRGQGQSVVTALVKQCTQMNPDAKVQVKLKGSYQLSFNNSGVCEQTCEGTPHSALTSMLNGSAVGTLEYCHTVGKTTRMPSADLKTSANVAGSISKDGSTTVQLDTRTAPYNCDNYKGFGRVHEFRGLEVQVCESGYCR